MHNLVVEAVQKGLSPSAFVLATSQAGRLRRKTCLYPTNDNALVLSPDEWTSHSVRRMAKTVLRFLGILLLVLFCFGILT